MQFGKAFFKNKYFVSITVSGEVKISEDETAPIELEKNKETAYNMRTFSFNNVF